ncbi:MAG: hypothetical protein KKA79_03510, partial [Nanoarchaeota archaeon]|nr:hypothetical protein [Nanoarchaeota archaeon]
MKEIIKDKTNLDAYREQCCTRTGVCYTYWNEFFPKAIEFEKRGIEGVADNIKKCPIRNYRARV